MSERSRSLRTGDHVTVVPDNLHPCFYGETATYGPLTKKYQDKKLTGNYGREDRCFICDDYSSRTENFTHEQLLDAWHNEVFTYLCGKHTCSQCMYWYGRRDQRKETVMLKSCIRVLKRELKDGQQKLDFIRRLADWRHG